MPWLPISVIGTAVAFYVGFKNNQAYDRLWEARKIWGSIINDSRTWASMAKAYVSNIFAEKDATDAALREEVRVLVYRHLAWLYTLRSQLLVPTPWEHISLGRWSAKSTKKRMENFGVGLINDHNTEQTLKELLPEDEYEDP